MILLAAMLPALPACGGGKTQDVELTVFAAASMTETLTEIKAAYEKDNPGVTLTFNFDSSGTLLTQIKEGAVCDLFISAAPKQMKEVTTQVSEASVDCGVIYCTDAFSAGLTVVDSATAGMCGQVIYPVSVLKDSKNAEAAQAFLDYLTGSDAMAVFEGVGFSPAG